MVTSDLFRLDGKSAIVTGAVGILGQHFCRGLAAYGAHLAVVDLDADATANAAEQLQRDFGIRAVGIGCDITQPAAVAAMVEQAVAALGPISILHNNAATKGADLSKFFAPFEQYELATWREIMAVNIDGMFLVAQAVGKHMVEAGRGGSIIQTASIYGIAAPDQRIYEGSQYMGMAINTPAVYSASKAAVVGLSQYLASYWAPHAIRVNTLTPGGIGSGQNDVFQTRYANRVPLARMGTADELIGALIYLASDASSYVTGQNLVVDGGLTAW